MVADYDNMPMVFEACNSKYFGGELPTPDFDLLLSSKNICGYFQYNKGGWFDKNIYNPIISTSDAILGHIEGVDMSYLKGFLSGGPLAFSCDLTKLLPEHFDELKEHISQFKQDRTFWKSAECRIKADTDSVLVLQFSNRDSSKIVIQVFCKRVMQKGIFLYPDADPCKNYKTDTGEMICGKDLSSDGIYLPFAPNTDFKMNQLTLTAEE